ncbi:MAG: glycosyltransferase family 2 protein [Selenomonadaceae bacterium]|nr:glycosyltransferase family 2 protein [Selenomonadaceae bacterium]
MEIPAVSVIIPMYNAEKYIGECLDSLLAQTFQNFEVIIVDDCSTDNSVAVVQSYAEIFGGRLKISRTKKNFGGPGEPSNIGIELSRGEYLLILDNDDTITPTALYELYPIAKKFNADVVACEKYYNVPEQFWYDAEFRKQLKPFTYQTGVCVTEPTLIIDDFAERVKECFQRRFLWNIWSKLIRRDFLKENRIYFVQNMIQDMLFTCCLIYTAERFVRVPNVINYYREVRDSLSHKKYSYSEYLLKYTRALTTGLRYLDKFLDNYEFFRQHTNIKYLAVQIYIEEALNYTLKIYSQVPASSLDEILRKEFGNDEDSAIMTLIFSMLNIQYLQRIHTQRQLNQIVTQANQQINQFNQFAAQAKQRIAELENEIKRLKNEE